MRHVWQKRLPLRALQRLCHLSTMLFPQMISSWVAESINQRSRDKLFLAQLPQLLSQLSPDAESSRDAVQPTYSPSNREQTIRVFEKYAVRFLSPDEVAEQMPLYFATLNKTRKK
jgi:hypothetical protein